MNAFLASIKEAQRETTPPDHISRVLFDSQKTLCYSLFKVLPKQDEGGMIRQIWSFFLFAASHSSSTVRLAAYQAAGSFLLKLTPFYSRQIRASFSEILTLSIARKSPAMITSIFAFISRNISPPFIESFVTSTPIFDFFIVDDPAFTERLPSIIANIGPVDVNWFRSLLKQLLSSPTEGHNHRSIILSIAALVRHHPMELISEIIAPARSEDPPGYLFSLLAFVLGGNHRLFDLPALDLASFAKKAASLLADPSTNVTDGDSALQFLSVDRPGFTIIISEINDQTLTVSADGSPIAIGIARLNNRPAFFTLPLPLRYLQPDPDRDGPVTIAAKFASLARLAERDPSSAEPALAILAHYAALPYSDVVSAALRRLARFRPSADAVRAAVLRPPEKWFQAVDTLKIIKVTPPGDFERIFGPNGFAKIVEALIGCALIQNDQVLKKSKRLLIQIVNPHNFESATAQILSRIDIFNPRNLVVLLKLARALLTSFPQGGRDHVVSAVCALLELSRIYREDLAVLCAMFRF
jgi:hypothetical protein